MFTRWMELLQLIEDGALQAGTELHHCNRTGQVNATGTVTLDGIRVQNQVFRSPSYAARSIIGREINGWNWWRLPDGRPLSALRKSAPPRRARTKKGTSE